MPELPEVETVCRGLKPVLEGARLARVVARRPDLRFPLPDGFGQRLTGRVVRVLKRRAKYLLFHLDDASVLIAHLGMSGRFKILQEDLPLEPHDHVIFSTDGALSVRFNDPRRFGFMDLTTEEALAEHAMLRKLGPEPLGADFNGAVLAENLNGKRTPIKAALLDQRVVSGVGNIYACEALYRAGISPRRLASTIQGGRAEKLAKAVKDVLAEAIEAGGSSLKDHRQPSGELGYFQHNFGVYGRAGAPCPDCDCSGGVRQIVQSGRSTFYCSRRQR